MTFKPNYVPKSRKKVNYWKVVPFIVLAAIGTYFLLDRYVFKPQEKIAKTYTICNLTEHETREIIRMRDYAKTMPVEDYGMYGESLGLYRNQYNVLENDFYTGKTFFLNNLCYDEEAAYMMDQELDRKLPINELKNGFYELEVLDGLDRYFLESEDKIKESFYGVSRDGFVKKATIHADENLFLDEKGQALLEKNIVYLEIEEVERPNDHYDIALDPSRLVELWEGFIDYGSNREDVVEAHAMYRLAEDVQKELEKHGLKVGIVRTDDKAKNINDKGGRIDTAYQMKAKYYLGFAFPSSNFDHDKGVTVLYSSHSSNYPATVMMKTLKEKTSIEPSHWTGEDDIDGVYPTYREEGLDRKTEIRETGGKFTGAGLSGYNDFAKNKKQGMQTLVIEYGYMSSDHDFKVWQTEYDKIVDATVEGILRFLKISE